MNTYELKQDAIKHGFRPGAIVERQLGNVTPVQLTSWPFQHHGNRWIMARLIVGDALSNREILYDSLSLVTGEKDL